MRRFARWSSDGRYRYSLTRAWDRSRPRVSFLMLNPATADGRKDDRTIRRCIDFAERAGFGSLTVVNLFAYASTNPDELLDVPDPIGAENDAHILRAYVGSVLTIAAWGANRFAEARARQVTRFLDHDFHVLELNTGGAPRHPLYVPRRIRPRPWYGPSAA